MRLFFSETLRKSYQLQTFECYYHWNDLSLFSRTWLNGKYTDFNPQKRQSSVYTQSCVLYTIISVSVLFTKMMVINIKIQHWGILSESLAFRYPDVPDTAEAISQLGCKHICKHVNEAHVDEKNKIVTTCAFMCKAPLHEIFDGIGEMVQEVLKLAWIPAKWLNWPCLSNVFI